MLQAFGQALTEAWCHMATFLPNGRVDEVPGGTLVSTDAPTEDLRGPLTLRAGASAGTIEAARAITQAQGRPLAVDSLHGIADELRSTFGRSGFRQVAQRRVMAVHVDGLHAPRHRVVIAGPEHVDTMRDLQIEAFGIAPAAAECLVSAASVAASPHALVLAGGTALSMATAHPTSTGIGIFGVATRRTARREGLATSVVSAAAAAGAERTDAAIVWLQANDDVAGAYVPMGFATVCRSEVWLDA